MLEGAFGKPTLTLAPIFDVEAELEQRGLLSDRSVIAHSGAFRPRSQGVQEGFSGGSDTVLSSALNDARTDDERVANALLNCCERVSEEEMKNVIFWHFEKGLGKEKTINKIWQATKGGGTEYQQASRKYAAILAVLES